MSDIVERLKRARANGDPKKYAVWMTVAEAHEAADEIERLREANQVLVKTLRKIADTILAADDEYGERKQP